MAAFCPPSGLKETTITGCAFALKRLHLTYPTSSCTSGEGWEADAIGELCIALAHRWEGARPFVILTGYFDESGTHGGDVALMGGMVGEARGWRKFEKRAGKLFRKFKVDVFHNTDLWRGDKSFAGWSVDKKIEFLDELAHIANETVLHGFVSVLKYDDYKFYEGLAWPKGTRKDSMYTLLFRACLAATVGQVARLPNWYDKEPSLNIVLESGHRNAPDVVRLYDYMSKKTENGKAFAGLTFKDKKTCLPLAAADMLAYGAYRQETNAKPKGIARKPTKSEASYRGNFFRIGIDRERLEMLNEQAKSLAKQDALAKP